MTDWLLALVPQYGLWLLAATTFFSCLALPFPASIMMLTAGGFVAAGDLALLGRCDALMTVDNWRESQGARAEVDYAHSHGIPVFHELPALEAWLHVTPIAVTMTTTDVIDDLP